MTATATATPSSVTLPDPNVIRDRLGELGREANYLRRLLRLLNKRPPAPTPTTSAGTGSAYAGSR
jgi:hypothetical protein